MSRENFRKNQTISENPTLGGRGPPGPHFAILSTPSSTRLFQLRLPLLAFLYRPLPSYHLHIIATIANAA